MTKTILIIGGNRGIGLGLVKQFASAPDTKVIATARTTTDDLDSISDEHPGVLTVLKLNVTSKESISSFGKELHEVVKDGIDIFIGNAGVGIGIWSNVLDTAYEDYILTYQLNVVGLIFTFKEAHDLMLLRPTKKAIFISSDASLVSGPTPVRTSSYGASKAALNHVCISLGTELESEGIAIAAVNPGPTYTRAFDTYIRSNAGEEAIKHFGVKTTAECSDAIVNKIIPKVTLENTGKFFDISGEIVPL